MNQKKFSMTRTVIVAAAFVLVSFSSLATTNDFSEAPAQRDARTAWWREARFGMFIHWDMSSVAGTEISWSRNGSRPLDNGSDPAGYVADPVYDNLYKNFNPTNFDAKAWVRLAKAAGMKYLVFTAKHHGGFCMWDTKLTDYSIMHTPFHRDVVKELAEACHAEGLRFGIYYSPRDWHEPDYGIGDNEKYVDYMNGQLSELLTNYGQVDVLWFDSYGRGDPLAFWRIPETWTLIKSLQPQIVINNRLAALRATNNPPESRGDFDTPEQKLGSYNDTRPWESCITLITVKHGGWSYRPDGKVKSVEEALRTLVNCATGDGNLLLDVGPDSLGVIPDEQAKPLLAMGQWLATNGESIYGTRGGPFKPGDYGGSTRRDRTIYLHILKWAGATLKFPPLPLKVLSSRVLDGGKADVKQSDAGLEISVPENDRKPVDTVIALTVDGDTLKIPAMKVPKPIETSLFAPNIKRVVFLGDSITYAGQYVEDVAAYEHARFPDRKMEFINVGLPSETVSGLSEPGHAGGKFPRPDLHERLARVLDKTKPDLVFACYGMNDGIYQPFDETRFKLFQDGIEWLHSQVEKSGVRIIHVTPPVFDEAKGGHPGYAEVLDRYSAWLIAQRTNGWDVADLHFPMKQYLAAERETNVTFALTRDGIHPGDLGHWLMAQQILLYQGAKDAATAGSIDELMSRYPNGEDILHQDQKDQTVWKDAWLTAIGHKRPGMKPGLPIEIDPVTGSARFMTNSASKNGGNL